MKKIKASDAVYIQNVLDQRERTRSQTMTFLTGWERAGVCYKR